MSEPVWTNHVLERIRDRKISQSQIIETLRWPESTNKSSDGATNSQRKFGNQTVSVI